MRQKIPKQSRKKRWICLCWLITLGPALECGWYSQCHAIGENWFSQSQQVSIANSFVGRVRTLCPLPLPHPGIWSSLNLYKSSACCYRLLSSHGYQPCCGSWLPLAGFDFNFTVFQSLCFLQFFPHPSSQSLKLCLPKALTFLDFPTTEEEGTSTQNPIFREPCGTPYPQAPSGHLVKAELNWMDSEWRDASICEVPAMTACGHEFGSPESR